MAFNHDQIPLFLIQSDKLSLFISMFIRMLQYRKSLSMPTFIH